MLYSKLEEKKARAHTQHRTHGHSTVTNITGVEKEKKKDKKSICRPMVPSLGTVGKKHLSLMHT